MTSHRSSSFFFFFNDTATTEIYTLSLHDALPILPNLPGVGIHPAEGKIRSIPINQPVAVSHDLFAEVQILEDRKSTRLNSSHQIISYAVFCLKKKNKKK